MKRSILLFFIICLVCISSPAQKAKRGFNTDIVLAKHATHVARITENSIVIISGSTYQFTVDTPEDSGLVSTKIKIDALPRQIKSRDGSLQQYTFTDRNGVSKKEGELINSDKLIVTSENGKVSKAYRILVQPMAISGQLHLERKNVTINTKRDLILSFTAGQRSPDATVDLYLPAGIEVTMNNTRVNVIGRGEVKLKDLATQSIGRVGGSYSYSRVGEVVISRVANGGTHLSFRHLDLRPANSPDLKIVIENARFTRAGNYHFKATYTTSKPEVFTSAGTGQETAILTVNQTISDFERIPLHDLQYKETMNTYTIIDMKWTSSGTDKLIHMQHSMDSGKSWKNSHAVMDLKKGNARISALQKNKLYYFRLSVTDGEHKGNSNTIQYYSGKIDIKTFGVNGEDNQDNTEKINKAIDWLHSIGGGTLLFSAGVYSVRTVHLKSNVYLFIGNGATIKALKGGDAPEPTWYSDKKYRSGTSPTDPGPYVDPENWLTKQDIGHTFFRNGMFTGERLDNIKIIGNGHITGNGNLVTGDRVMNNPPDNRCDKMFSLKLCTNIEIGGLYREEDLWYDPEKDEPYYIGKDNSRVNDISNMLHIDRGGHFVLLATGTDNINVHDTYFGKQSTTNARDIYDFMGCNNVTVTNIYSRQSSDDIVKPGSDCSLGFTRPVSKYRIRNIIGDTNCNLFQIGSETADDIMDICVDNIYVLGANKAGFSISTNDGGHIKDIHLNCGHTGKLHSRSKMYRSFAPFFISISNRGRVLGAEASRYSFTENGTKRNELLVKNVNIGQVENIFLNSIDVYEVYGGSSYSGVRWKPYDGSQRRATSIIAGYQLPEPDSVEEGLNFTLPNGQHTGYIKNIVFNDVNILVKGGNPLSDAGLSPPELGVGQYNVSNLKVQPSYGIWARHVKELSVKECSFNYEKRDSRYVLFLDDVIGAQISSVKMVRAQNIGSVIKLKNSTNVTIENAIYFEDEWGKSPAELKRVSHTTGDRIVRLFK